MSVYSYDLITYFPGGFSYPHKLHQSIKSSSITTPILHINTSDTVDIYFSTALSTNDQTTLNNLITSYTNTINSSNIFNIRQQHAVGVHGGTFSQGNWVNRNLNSMDVNDDTSITISSGSMIVVAGTYQIKVSATVGAVTNHQIRLYNTTNNTTLLTGITSSSNIPSTIDGMFTLTSTSTIAVQHRCTKTVTTTGLGVAAGYGTEVYVTVQIIKL